METETELFERRTRVNQLGCFLGMKIVVPLMEQSGGCSIANRFFGMPKGKWTPFPGGRLI
jgi:hypothetical protein